jgi:hypothetical protein
VPSVLLVIDGDEEPSVEIEVFEVPGVEASNAMGRLALEADLENLLEASRNDVYRRRNIHCDR